MYKKIRLTVCIPRKFLAEKNPPNCLMNKSVKCTKKSAKHSRIKIHQMSGAHKKSAKLPTLLVQWQKAGGV
jgi:hypothetical protein